jgi:hypothetical protein
LSKILSDQSPVEHGEPENLIVSTFSKKMETNWRRFGLVCIPPAKKYASLGSYPEMN